jgi:hypothetical protein
MGLALHLFIYYIMGMSKIMYYYGAFTKQDECLYIGKSVNPYSRATYHMSYSSWRKECQYFKILEIEEDKEMELISEYKPLHNKEKYTNSVVGYSVGDIIWDYNTSLLSTKKNPQRVKYIPTGEIFESGYAAAKAGLCCYDITNRMKRNPSSHYHDKFIWVD